MKRFLRKRKVRAIMNTKFLPNLDMMNQSVRSFVLMRTGVRSSSSQPMDGVYCMKGVTSFAFQELLDQLLRKKVI